MDSRIKKLQTIMCAPHFPCNTCILCYFQLYCADEVFAVFSELRQLGPGGFRLLNNLGSGFGCQCLELSRSRPAPPKRCKRTYPILNLPWPLSFTRNLFLVPWKVETLADLRLDDIGDAASALAIIGSYYVATL